ncbi:hypothetical protein [Streptomyces sp. NPDC001652]|uniref:hypothetical protein n=1 Tax=Streptomyces sp. NPDC001652 TaxID=3154393 RepID=UPI003318D3E0
MSTLVALVIPLLVLVGMVVVLGLGCAVHRRPALTAPITVAIAGAAVLIAVITTLMSVTG